jgi:hypothetical protein
MMHKLPFILLLVFTWSLPVHAQTCKVEDADIAQEYSGECKDGVADGLGIAKGRDTYHGGFQKGKKHGQGVYTWADGSKFETEFFQDRAANGFGTYTEPLRIHNPAKKTSPVKGRIVGDVYIEQGWWESKRLVIACTDKIECQLVRQAKDNAALEHIHTGICADPTTRESQIADNRFIGVWSGNWDATWPVRYSVSNGRQPHTYLVMYEWGEKLGEPLNKRLFSACLKGDTLVIDAGFIDMKVNAEDPNAAALTGTFSNTRKATLTRLKN